MDSELREYLDANFKRIDERFEELEARIERVETNLLMEFHKWASPVEARSRSHAAALRALDLEMEALSDRVKGLEEGKTPS